MRPASERRPAMVLIAAAKTSSPAQKNSWRRGCQLDMVRVWAAAPIGAQGGSVVCRQAMRAGRVRRQRMGATGPDQEHRNLGDGERSISVRDSGAGRLGVAGDTADPGVPAARGLYDPALDKDSCGVGFIADIKGRKSHQIVEDALTILVNLEHRGAVGADPRAGDGAGILVQIPHQFFARKTAELGFTLPAPGEYAIGALFLPREEGWRHEIANVFAEEIANEGMQLLGWRDVPTDNSTLGESVKPTEPVHQQIFIGKGSARAAAISPRTSSNAASTSFGRPFRGVSIRCASGARPVIIRSRCRAAP
jgi:hypothetical protein